MHTLDYSSAHSMVLVANSTLLLLSSLLAILHHALLDTLAAIVTFSLGALFSNNQASELCSPTCTYSLLLTVSSLIATQIHAGHLLLGTSLLVLHCTIDILLVLNCHLLLLFLNY
jgi:hypothetical protein